MDRRTFVTLVAGTCLLEPLAVRAQQTGKVFRIGLLVPRTEPDTRRTGSTLETLRTGLRDLGWVEGKNLVIEIRWAGVNPQRQRELAAELKALPSGADPCVRHDRHPRGARWCSRSAHRHDQRRRPGGRGVRGQPGPAGWRPDRHFGGGRRGSCQTSGAAVGCRAATQEGQRADEQRQPCQRILLRRDVVARKDAWPAT